MKESEIHLSVMKPESAQDQTRNEATGVRWKTGEDVQP